MYPMKPCLIVSIIHYVQNVHGNKYDDFFRIIYNCATSWFISSTKVRYIIKFFGSTLCYQSTLTDMAANKTYNFWEKNML